MDPAPLVQRFVAAPDQVGPARRAVERYARVHGAVDPDAVALAVSEAVTNVVLHAYLDAPAGGCVELTAQRHCDDGLEIVVSDEGRGVQPRTDSPGLGLGLPLIAQLTECFVITDRPEGGTRMSMTFQCGVAASEAACVNATDRAMPAGPSKSPPPLMTVVPEIERRQRTGYA